DPAGYNNYGSGNYHWCNGTRISAGDIGHTPWTTQLNLGVHYSPEFADHKLGINLDIFNALNGQKAVQTDPAGISSYDKTTNTLNVNNSYGDGIFFQPPRTIRLSLTYDY
ncbi:MAG: Oar protein, partial [Pseudoxanthomonas sp.]